ncbi:MAG: hypothetical protein R2813_11120 [Flavobacteriales bacterium]
MNALTTIITGSALFIALTSSNPVDKKEIVKENEVHIKVSLAYEGCECDPAVYQIQGMDHVKIADLEKIERNVYSESRSKNAKTISNVLAEINLAEYYIKSMESIKRDDCGYDMHYILSARGKN